MQAGSIWTPDAAALQHVLNLLQNAGSSDTEVQRQLTEVIFYFFLSQDKRGDTLNAVRRQDY